MEKLPEQAVDPMLAKPTTDHNKPMARASLFGGNISPNTVAIKAIYPAVIKLTYIDYYNRSTNSCNVHY